MSLREIIENASANLEKYKHPDVDEAKDRLNDILVAADLGSIELDQLVYIDVGNDTIRIRTEWSARGCDQTSDYDFPVSILDAEDPIKEAKIYGLILKLNHHKNEVNSAERNLAHHSAKVLEFTAQLEQLAQGETADS